MNNLHSIVTCSTLETDLKYNKVCNKVKYRPVLFQVQAKGVVQSLRIIMASQSKELQV